MQVRPATPQDKPAIIALLKMSLGEAMIPKSEILWNWKHEQNPFGPSFLLLAEENEQLVGLRAFMQWEWQWKGQIYKAIRAVDTATHPDYQGKGIFKKLTLHQINICKEHGVSFVFNTPNNQSKPGYLKMGWVEQGKLPLKVKLVRPLSMAYLRFFKGNNPVPKTEDNHNHSSPEALSENIKNLITQAPRRTEQVICHLSREYISWRYENNPLFRYNYFTDNKNFLMIGRIKLHSFGRELRIVEFLLLNPDADRKKINNELRIQVDQFCKTYKIDFVAVSGLQYSLYKDCFKWMGLIPIRAVGPVITLRDLNMNDQFPTLLQINNWSYSLGDLELF